MSNKFSGGYITCTKQFFEELPIANSTENEQNSIMDLVDQILTAKQANPKADTSKLEQQIDQLVYQLYHLTEEEIAIIKGQ